MTPLSNLNMQSLNHESNQRDEIQLEPQWCMSSMSCKSCRFCAARLADYSVMENIGSGYDIQRDNSSFTLRWSWAWPILKSTALIFCYICKVFCVCLLWGIGQFHIPVSTLHDFKLISPLFSLFFSLVQGGKRIPVRLFEVVLIVKEDIEKCQSLPILDPTQWSRLVDCPWKPGSHLRPTDNHL